MLTADIKTLIISLVFKLCFICCLNLLHGRSFRLPTSFALVMQMQILYYFHWISCNPYLFLSTWIDSKINIDKCEWVNAELAISSERSVNSVLLSSSCQIEILLIFHRNCYFCHQNSLAVDIGTDLHFFQNSDDSIHD